MASKGNRDTYFDPVKPHRSGRIDAGGRRMKDGQEREEVPTDSCTYKILHINIAKELCFFPLTKRKVYR
jgi:hypothetical protein